MSTYDRRFGSMIKAARQKRGLTLEQVCERVLDASRSRLADGGRGDGVHLSPERLEACERLEAPPLPGDFLSPLARVLGFTPRELVVAAGRGHEVTISSKGKSPAKRAFLLRLADEIEELGDEHFKGPPPPSLPLEPEPVFDPSPEDAERA